MNDQNRFEEENIHLMIRAGMGGQARLDRSLYGEMLNRLKSEIPEPSIAEFPVAALGLIMGVLWSLVLWWFGQSGNARFWEAFIIAILLVANLLCIPIGSILIVSRRRHV
ncbi:MAG: hypothetical protein GYA34_09955 [Chloroflexi bacterium]|nr:hypothetical protein [Chloroflexota bacterium]